MFRAPKAAALIFAACLVACQSPTDPDDVADFMVLSANPDPATSNGPTGRTYKVEGDDNEPDEIREYDWRTVFTVTARVTEDANDDSVNLEFPLTITSATINVQQATGGIVTPPTGGEIEHFEFVSQASGNSFAAVGSTVDITFDVVYDLPSRKREALITVTLGFRDDDGRTYSETLGVKVAP